MSASLLFPKIKQPGDWLDAPLMPAYADETVACLGELSRLLLGTPAIRQYPDIAALAFWLRPANLKTIADCKLSDRTKLLRPLGNVLHIAPANVDTLFFYSGALSLLAGNRNLIRLSRRRSDSQALILEALSALYHEPKWRNVLDRFYLFESERNDEFLIANCRYLHLRIVWGGNATINAIRKLPIPAHCRELSFPDKFSLALLSASALNQASANEISSLLQRFVKDSYAFGQQACSSPRSIIWLGTPAETQSAQQRFWPELENYLNTVNYQRSASEQMQSLIGAQSVGCLFDNTRMHIDSPWFCRVDITDLNSQLEQCHQGNGLFYEQRIEFLDQLTNQLRPHHQTLSYWGVDGGILTDWLRSKIPSGIDRVVAIGQALDFDYIWDGIDLLEQMTKITRTPQ